MRQHHPKICIAPDVIATTCVGCLVCRLWPPFASFKAENVLLWPGTAIGVGESPTLEGPSNFEALLDAAVHRQEQGAGLDTFFSHSTSNDESRVLQKHLAKCSEAKQAKFMEECLANIRSNGHIGRFRRIFDHSKR